MDYKNENVNMFDLIAYRIKFIPHPKAGDILQYTDTQPPTVRFGAPPFAA